MNAQTIIDHAHELGIALRVEGDHIYYAPKSAAPPEFVEELRQHKAELLERLRRRGYTLNYPNDTEAGDAEIAEVEAGISRDGFVILWSNTLVDLVAYALTEADAASVPAGIVTYTMAELRQLFGPDGDKKPGARKLRMIHAAKQMGARVVPKGKGE